MVNGENPLCWRCESRNICSDARRRRCCRKGVRNSTKIERDTRSFSTNLLQSRLRRRQQVNQFKYNA